MMEPMVQLRTAMVVLALGLVASSFVAAQASADDSARARVLFERGYEALMAGRFPEARDLLRDSLAAQARPATAFNLVLALLGTEEPVAAGNICDGLLEGGYGALDGPHRREAVRECARANREVGTLVVDVSDAADGDGTPPAVRVDAAVVATEERTDGTQSVRVDPGIHVVSARSPDGRSVDERVTVGRGETVSVALSLPPSLTSDERTTGESGPPWLLIGIGAAVAAAIGIAIAIAIAVASASGDSGTNEPITDPVWGVTMALH